VLHFWTTDAENIYRTEAESTRSSYMNPWHPINRLRSNTPIASEELREQMRHNYTKFAADKDIVVFSINLGEAPELVRQFVKLKEMTSPQCILSAAELVTIRGALNRTKTPTAWLIDPDGKFIDGGGVFPPVEHRILDKRRTAPVPSGEKR
jgi:hypothetical protein